MKIKNGWIWLCVSTLLLDSSVSIAAGSAASIHEAPLAVDVISGEDLQQSGITDINDLVNKTPGLSSSYSSDPRPNIRLRGTSPVTDTSPMVMIDGVVSPGGLGAVDQSMIDRVEVLRGASAVSLYGAAAEHGVIQVHTRPADGSEFTIAGQGSGACGANSGVPLPNSLYAGTQSTGIGGNYWHTGQPRDTETGASEGTSRNFADAPAISVRIIVQRFPGIVSGAGKGTSSTAAPYYEFDIPTDFATRAGRGFNIGANYYLPYSYEPQAGLDVNDLYDVPGQGGIGNDTCTGSATFAGLLYLTATALSVEDQWAFGRVGATSAASNNAEPIIVGVVDTGIDWDHLDLEPDAVWRNEDEIPANGIDDDNNGYVDDVMGWDFVAESNAPWDFDGHGTFVAGIVAATHNNDTGIDGINPNAKIMVLKALGGFSQGRGADIAQAIAYAADNGARIINLSLSPDFSSIVQDAVDYAEAKGVLVITAAGNESQNLDTLQPPGLRRVMTVAATDSDDKRAAFSNTGSNINLAAPGVDVVSLRARRTDFMFNRPDSSYEPGAAFLGDDSRYYRATGSSFAAAITSGVASLVWSQRPTLTHTEVQRILEQSARDVESPGRDRFTGYGIVDAKAAMEADPAFYLQAAILGVRRMEQDRQKFLQVVGTADANEFSGARLEIGLGESPASWIAIEGELGQPVALGKLGQIPIDQFLGAPTWTVRLLVDHGDGTQREARYVIDVT